MQRERHPSGRNAARMSFYIRTFDFQRYFRYNGCRKLKEVERLKQKYYLALTTEEWRMAIDSLNSMRNRLISEGR